MSIYGISRSLASRDLGPAQLLPAVDDFRQRSEAACTRMLPMLERVEEDAHATALAEPALALTAEARRVIADVPHAFARAGKLGARARLDLERNIDQIGGELQATHRMLGLMSAALAPRPIQLSLSDLLRGRWGPQVTFVSRRVELCVDSVGGKRFEADPKLVWAVVEHVLYSVPTTLPSVFAHVEHQGGNSQRPVLRVREGRHLTDASLRWLVDLGPRLNVETDVMRAIMLHLGWVSSGPNDDVTITIAA